MTPFLRHCEADEVSYGNLKALRYEIATSDLKILLAMTE